MIAQAINFGVVFTVLYIYALKPLSKLMEERKNKIEKGIEDAKLNASTLEKTNEEYEKALSKARTEAQVIFQNGKKEAETKKAQMLKDAESEVAKVVENGRKALESEKTKMVGEAKKEIVTLAMSIAEKVLGEKVDKSFNERAIKDLSNL